MSNISLNSIFETLREAQTRLALENRQAKDRALRSVMDSINASRKEILRANGTDADAARSAGIKEALVDRLLLDEKRIDAVIRGIDTVVRQEDPIGRVRGWTLPNGLLIEETTAPLGVAAIIYESLPNVTADAFCLAYKAG